MKRYVVLRRSELGNSANDYFEKPLFFYTLEEAEGAVEKWRSFLDGYPCCGDAFVATIPIYGRWKGAGMGDYCCSWCGSQFSGSEDWEYCPKCGAYMQG